jgi:hypothetical protein
MLAGLHLLMLHASIKAACGAVSGGHRADEASVVDDVPLLVTGSRLMSGMLVMISCLMSCRPAITAGCPSMAGH